MDELGCAGGGHLCPGEERHVGGEEHCFMQHALVQFYALLCEPKTAVDLTCK